MVCPSSRARTRAPRARVAWRRASGEPGRQRAASARGLGRAEHAFRLGLEVGDRRGRDGRVGGGRDAAATPPPEPHGGGAGEAVAPRAGGGATTSGMTSSVSSAARGCGRWSMATPFRVGLRARGDGCDQPVPRAPVPPQGEEQRRQAARQGAAGPHREAHGGGERDGAGARVSPDPRRDEVDVADGDELAARPDPAPESSRRAAARRRWSTSRVSCKTVAAASRPAEPAGRRRTRWAAAGRGPSAPAPPPRGLRATGGRVPSARRPPRLRRPRAPRRRRRASGRRRRAAGGSADPCCDAAPGARPARMTNARGR